MSERSYYRDANGSGSRGGWFWGLIALTLVACAFYLGPTTTRQQRLADLQIQLEYTREWIAARLPGDPTLQEESKLEKQKSLALLPAPLRYLSAAYGNFIFSNNPEQLCVEDLADKSLGNTLLFQARVSGPTQLLAAHINKVSIDNVGQEVYFGVQFYNPGNQPVTFIIERMGRSIGDWSGSVLWKQFLQYRPRQITLAPQEMQWLFCDQGIPYDQVFDAAMALDIPLEQAIEINLAAFTKLKNLDGHAMTRPMVLREESDGQQSARVYSGLSAYPLLGCRLEWIIDDSVVAGSALPLEYDNRQQDYWITHDCKSSAALREDILPLTVEYPDGVKVIDAWSNDDTGLPYNLANWGVQYVQTFVLENHGTCDRVLRYVVQPSGATPKQTLLAWVEGDTLQVIHHDEEDGRKNPAKPTTLWEVSLKPGERIEKSVFLVLAAGSYGGVRHSIQVDE